MQRSSIIYDGLWRCLCPSFDRTIVRHARRLPTSARSRALRCELPRGASSSTTIQRRPYSAEASTTIDAYIQGMLRTGPGPPGPGSTTPAPRQIKVLTSKAPPSDAILFAASIDELTDHLHTLRGREQPWISTTSTVDRHKRIVHLVRHLVVQRRQRLTAFLYECIVDTMGDPENSGTALVALIKDMAQQGIEPTQAFYTGALESLMVHPNYAAMLEIMHHARACDWPDNKPTLTVALLRDEQYELAYDTLMGLHASSARVEPWIYDIFVFVFGKMGFVDEMMDILVARLSLASTDGLDALQLYALDVCSAAFHYPGTLAGWNTMVRSGKVTPPDGVVENVLNTASRQADTALASEALDMLAQRTKLHDYHYDSLVDAFIQDGDLGAATRLHCIMHTSGVPVTKAAARRLVAAAGTARRAPELNEWLRTATTADAEEKLLAPPRLVNAAITAHLLASDVPLALDLHARYEQLCGERWPPLEVMLRLLPHYGGDDGRAEAAAGLRDRLLDELRAQEGEEPRRMIAQKLRAAAEELVKDGRTDEGRLFAEKLDEVLLQPQIEQPS
ncbi:pentatricopeptide repeat protein [Cordyceps militaris CM01]|uniref:Pentatricopeptide repeat protein n=1 Tax=Cordyceps militaris (strain CM01) TaxID=983644 RepID=G3J890_CORMM|nr:pentatricopeptide repeat protein [Cordyceps militaris CM01]EGX94729.1 pentatricopeptide repeat protein [Cordyceps militaris CM01]